MTSTTQHVIQDNTIQYNHEPTREVHLYFCRTCNPTTDFSQDMIDELAQLPRKIIYCDNWGAFTEALTLKPKSICFSVNELQYTSAIEILSMVRTLTKLANTDPNIPVAIGVRKDTNLAVLKEAQKSGIFGIIPKAVDFDWPETKKGCIALWSNIPYWPKHILDQLPGAKVVKPKSTDIQLTPRQEQVLRLIKERGASNKAIAKMLDISESTVKLHVGQIIKKFGVKNRTQLALFTK